VLAATDAGHYASRCKYLEKARFPVLQDPSERLKCTLLPALRAIDN